MAIFHRRYQGKARRRLVSTRAGRLYAQDDKEAHARVVRAKRKDLYSFPAGQSVGALTEETSVREVMYRLQSEYLEGVERLGGILEATA